MLAPLLFGLLHCPCLSIKIGAALVLFETDHHFMLENDVEACYFKTEAFKWPLKVQRLTE